MQISGTNFVFLNKGYYGVIFVDRATRRVRKVYRVHQDAGIDHSCNVFAAETGAYEIATKIPGLCDLVPQYIGPCPGQVIVDANGQDVTTKYFYPMLSFEAAFIDCEFCKLSCAPQEECRKITALFLKHGIRHICDADVYVRDGKIVTVIDFALNEVQLPHRELPDVPF